MQPGHSHPGGVTPFTLDVATKGGKALRRTHVLAVLVHDDEGEAGERVRMHAVCTPAADTPISAAVGHTTM